MYNIGSHAKTCVPTIIPYDVLATAVNAGLLYSGQPIDIGQIINCKVGPMINGVTQLHQGFDQPILIG